jgi:hypothetical protein
LRATFGNGSPMTISGRVAPDGAGAVHDATNARAHRPSISSRSPLVAAVARVEPGAHCAVRLVRPHTGSLRSELPHLQSLVSVPRTSTV